MKTKLTLLTLAALALPLRAEESDYEKWGRIRKEMCDENSRRFRENMRHDEILKQRVKGEFYPCKPDIFEETYGREVVTPPDGPTDHNFGYAVEALKRGHRVSRAGWNGKGMFLFLLPAQDGIPTKVIHDPALRSVIEEQTGGDTFDALGSIRMFTADKKILTGWLASQSDILAEDWVIIPT